METLPQTSSNVRMWCMFCHLSALLGLLFPFGNIIGPLVLWLVKRDESAEVAEHAKESLNFQISMTIYIVGLTVVAFILMFVLVGFLLIPIIALLGLADVVLVIIAAIKANDGQLYRYPLTIRLIN
ncbi:MAG TPA: DUF4870 domain-containing protein [Chthoniobacterales bacterium]|nr:DUF4870 domain-containing protein [Chthoniobacterales bacterium]